MESRTYCDRYRQPERRAERHDTSRSATRNNRSIAGIRHSVSIQMTAHTETALEDLRFETVWSFFIPRCGRRPWNVHSRPSRPNPLRTKAKHSRSPPTTRNSRAILMSDREYPPSGKALPTRRKVFCREPHRSLTISNARKTLDRLPHPCNVKQHFS